VTVLVITARFDATADRAVHELNQRGAAVARFDLAEFPQHARLTADFDGTWHTTLETSRRRIDLEEVTGIYYRRPGPIEPDPAMNGQERAWALAESRHALRGLLSALPDRVWLNHPRSAAVAESKPVQLQYAAASGLNVPSTLITNDPDAAREFAKRHAKICYKPLTATATTGGKALYATCLQIADLETPQAANISGAAHQFQAWIEAAHAVRLVAIDDQMYAAAIHAHSEAARTDWRSDYPALSYENLEVPAEVREGVRRLLMRLALRFASMDLLVDRDGTWWFIDLNPSGQWCWIPQIENSVAASLATALSEGPTP
jgi:ATP-grasp ribosomal peptide maturase